METQLIPITETNVHIFEVFVQDYEAEFSAITKKEPNAEGRFALEADWKAPNQGFYWFVKNKPVGFTIKANCNGRSDIAEFYILPCYRKSGLGKKLAFAVFDLFPGPWQVRQIPTAHEAIAFWRTVIAEYTQNHYAEDEINDPHWGRVIRQLFDSRRHCAVTIQVLKGPELLSNIAELTKLRTIVFREYPYLYEADPKFEKSYISLFANSKDACFIVAKIDDQIVGALSGLPLKDAEKGIRHAFDEAGIDTSTFYAICEIIVLKEHRSQKIGSLLYKELENFLDQIDRYQNVVFWQISKDPNDPKKPSDYFSLNTFWQKNGFRKHRTLTCHLFWKEISEADGSWHPFEFWIKNLNLSH